jgi:hypothetical protein
VNANGFARKMPTHGEVYNDRQNLIFFNNLKKIELLQFPEMVEVGAKYLIPKEGPNEDLNFCLDTRVPLPFMRRQ